MEQPRTLWSAAAASVLAVGVLVLYLAIIASEGEGELGSAVVVTAAVLLGLSAAALAVAARPAPHRFPLLLGAAAVLAVFTLLGAASIGLFLLPAALLAAVAAIRASRRGA